MRSFAWVVGRHVRPRHGIFHLYQPSSWRKFSETTENLSSHEVLNGIFCFVVCPNYAIYIGTSIYIYVCNMLQTSIIDLSMFCQNPFYTTMFPTNRLAISLNVLQSEGGLGRADARQSVRFRLVEKFHRCCHDLKELRISQQIVWNQLYQKKTQTEMYVAIFDLGWKITFKKLPRWS